jgi:hypothetical protein
MHANNAELKNPFWFRSAFIRVHPRLIQQANGLVRRHEIEVASRSFDHQSVGV